MEKKYLSKSQSLTNKNSLKNKNSLTNKTVVLLLGWKRSRYHNPVTLITLLIWDLVMEVKFYSIYRRFDYYKSFIHPSLLSTNKYIRRKIKKKQHLYYCIVILRNLFQAQQDPALRRSLTSSASSFSKLPSPARSNDSGECNVSVTHVSASHVSACHVSVNHVCL